MHKNLRLAALAALALLLTGLCLAGPVHTRRTLHIGCVIGCGNYCRAFGMATMQTCNSCYCYRPAPIVSGGCAGDGYAGCSGYSGCDGGYTGCDGGGMGGCGGGGCGGGGCGGGGC